MALTKITTNIIADDAVTADKIAAGAIDSTHVTGLSTSDISEGTNLYFTDARVGSYLTTNSYATESYVTTAVSNLVDAAPATLDTLNELAAALGDDANFSTTVTNSIATKVSKSGDTMTGNLGVTGTVTAERLIVESASDPTQITLRHTGNTSGLVIKNFGGAEAQLVNVDNGPMVFKTNDTERMRIDSSGRVGIHAIPKDWYPTEFRALQVGAGATFYGRSQSGDADKAGISANAYYDTTNTRWQYMASDNASRYDLAGSAHFWYTAPSGTADAAITWTQAMTLTSDSYLGIGETLPEGPLHVKSTGHASIFEGTAGNVSLQLLRSDTSAAVDYADIQFANSTGIAARINSRGEGGSASGNLTFQTRNTSGTLAERMRIDSSGNVGIGTQGPSANLEIYSALGSTAKLTAASNGTGGLLLSKGDSGIAYITNVDNYPLYLGANNTAGQVVLTEGGDLLINDNTARTSDPLQVRTNATGGGQGIYISRNDSNADQGIGRILFGNSTDNDLAMMAANTDGAVDSARLTFSTQQTGQAMAERVRITSTGLVGINTQPSNQLHVRSGTPNLVAVFESTDAYAAIQLKDSNGNVELQANGNSFEINPAGTGATHQFLENGTVTFLSSLVHTDVDQDFDVLINNTGTSNKGPRLRIRGGGQTGSVTTNVPWDSIDGYDMGSIWFDSSEGASVFAAGIVAYAEQDFNANDHPSALAFYTTPDLTGGTTNSAKERLRIGSTGVAHLSPSESDTRLYLGSQGGLFGANSSNWIRGSFSNLMFNAGGGSHIFEVGGTQRALFTTADALFTHTPGGDGYNLTAYTTDGSDPGLSLYRDGVVGFGISVRASTIDYAQFNVSSSGQAGYAEGGTTNAPIRIYQNNEVTMPASANWTSTVGHHFFGTGSHYMARNANSTGYETFIVNNLTSPGQIGILQYRENAGVRGDYLVATSAAGIYSTASSDYRFKENVTTIEDDILTKITNLRPVTYTHSSSYDSDTSRVYKGFIAHELQEVFPELVDGEKDAVWTEEELQARGDSQTITESPGDPKYQTVSYSRREWTLYFVKAIQQLKEENDALRARLDAAGL